MIKLANGVKTIQSISQDIGLRNARIDYKVDKPSLNLKINRDEASNLGVSADDIATTLDALYGSRRVTSYAYDGLTYNVILKADDDYLINETNLDNIYIKSSSTSKLIPLSNLVNNNIEATSKSLKKSKQTPLSNTFVVCFAWIIIGKYIRQSYKRI